MQPIPTTGPDTHHMIMADDGGAALFIAYGAIMAYFPMRPSVNYGEPANPSVLYWDNGNIVFSVAGKWPGKNDYSDGAIVPTINFPASGFKLDQWNHIFLSIDFAAMKLTGGNTDKTRDYGKILPGVDHPWNDETPVYPPTITDAPKSVMIINGGAPVIASVEKSKNEITGQDVFVNKNFEPALCTYMDKNKQFMMSLDYKGKLTNVVPGQQPAQIGFPIISQEIGRWGVTGINAKIAYAYTHIYFDKYIEPTEKNLQAFFVRRERPTSDPDSSSLDIAPPAKDAAVKQFGNPDVWCYRSKGGGVRFENSQKLDDDGKSITAKKFKLIGPNLDPDEDTPEFPPPSPIRDFRPGPGQGTKKKNGTTA